MPYNNGMTIQAIIFDLDGTLTVPILDFDAIRAEIGIESHPILEAMEQMSHADHQRATNILEHHERQSAEASTLNPGVKETLEQLRQQHIGIGLLTRNSRVTVERICQLHHLHFDAIVTRHDAPAKPDPAGVLMACGQLRVDPPDTLMVGDYLFDLQSGRAAGSRSVLITTQKHWQNFCHQADYVIDHLDELLDIVAELNA